MAGAKKTIELGGKQICYLLRESSRARCLRVAIRRGGAMVVTRPRGLAGIAVEDFLRSKSSWIVEKINLFSQRQNSLIWAAGAKEYRRYKNSALAIVQDKLLRFNGFYGFSIGSVAIRNQKTRWGSCSKSGAMNFNFRIALLPERLADYIVVHELCHLGELNHSKKFWSLVAAAIPDYAARRRQLRRIV